MSAVYVALNMANVNIKHLTSEQKLAFHLDNRVKMLSLLQLTSLCSFSNILDMTALENKIRNKNPNRFHEIQLKMAVFKITRPLNIIQKIK